MRLKTISGIGGLALMLVSGVALAQNSGVDASGVAEVPAPKPPNFPTLFPNPTNNNGYEEWVRAADLIQNNPKVETLSTQPEMTLAMKRRLLSDPDVEQALILLRAGLHKPVFSPRTNINENTTFRELSSLRQLARLLCVEQYVAFADGRVDKAIETLRVGLAFGYRVQTDSMISGLVGVAIDTMMLKQFSQHLDQLSTYHCDEVRRLVEDLLGAENPAVHIMAQEKLYILNILDSKRSDANSLLTMLKDFSGEEENGADSVAPLVANLKAHPENVNAVLDEAKDRISAMYDQAIFNLRVPALQRKPIVDDQSNSPGAILFRAVSVDPENVLKKYNNDQAQLRLLGVHAVIHHYRWDHNTLPDSLAELRAAKLVKDAFSGNQVVYTREGARYTLTAQGPEKRITN